jgi:hypothetical protein
MYDFDLRPILWAGMLIVGLLWGAWACVDYFFISEDIISEKRIEPTIKLTIKNNKVDTLYIYKSN